MLQMRVPTDSESAVVALSLSMVELISLAYYDVVVMRHSQE